MICVAALVILLPLQARNARTECKLLQEKFSERYETYRRDMVLRQDLLTANVERIFAANA